MYVERIAVDKYIRHMIFAQETGICVLGQAKNRY